MSIRYRFLILPLPLHLGVLDEGFGVGTSTGTLACFTALFGAVGHHVLLLGQGREAEQNQAPHQQLHPEGGERKYLENLREERENI